jgi:Cys-rich four helix bundle protein (predicted Tat secretion target)
MDAESGSGTSVNRRGLLIAAGALATAAAGGSAWAETKHDHSAHASQRPKLLAALGVCTSAGTACVSHCLASFREGDTSLADCASKVHEMVAVCSAMETLVASNSTYAEAMAKVCLAACEDCAAECRKHAEMHQECRACMEACEGVIPGLKKLAA